MIFFLSIFCLFFSTISADQTRDPKFVFQFITIAPEVCTTDSGVEGVCYSKNDCTNIGGTADGTCAKGLGVCCSVTRKCKTDTYYNNTEFTNDNYPSSEVLPLGNCDLTIYPVSDNICQIRLDFEEFEIAQPDVEGVCDTDFMLVTGGSSNVPMICGYNTNQHMYIDVDSTFSSVKLNVFVSSGGISTAKWKINVAQIACDSIYKAPEGCLQYHREFAGIVRSYNYQRPTATPVDTRQLANQNYGICIETNEDYCSIAWSKPPQGSNVHFTVSGDDPVAVGGAAGVSLTGDACLTDYVIIPGGEDTANALSADRFCGQAFPASVESTLRPFVLYFNTDDTETGVDAANIGFSLFYRQQHCLAIGR